MDIDVKTIQHYMATLVLGLVFITTIGATGCAVLTTMLTIATIIAGTLMRIAPTAFIGARRTRANLIANMEGWMAVSNAITGTGATAIRMRAGAGFAMSAIATIETGASYSK